MMTILRSYREGLGPSVGQMRTDTRGTQGGGDQSAAERRHDRLRIWLVIHSFRIDTPRLMMFGSIR